MGTLSMLNWWYRIYITKPYPISLYTKMFYIQPICVEQKKKNWKVTTNIFVSIMFCDRWSKSSIGNYPWGKRLKLSILGDIFKRFNTLLTKFKHLKVFMSIRSIKTLENYRVGSKTRNLSRQARERAMAVQEQDVTTHIFHLNPIVSLLV